MFVSKKLLGILALVSILFFFSQKITGAPDPANKPPSVAKFNSNVVKGSRAPAGLAVVSQGDSKSQWAKIKGIDIDSAVAGSPTGAGTVLTSDGAGKASWTEKIDNGAVTTSKIGDGQVTAAKLATNVIPATLPPSGNAGGDLSGTFPNPTIAANAVTAAKIAAFPKARTSGSALQNVPPNTSVTLNCDSANTLDFDNASMHTNSRLTVPVAGAYLVAADVQFGGIGGAEVIASLIVNNAAPISIVRSSLPTSSGVGIFNLTTIVALQAGDFVEIRVDTASNNLQSKANAFAITKLP